jgi:predicted DNA-binding transcriptional regulator AlpA
MPARKYREGEELERWEMRKRAHQLQMAIARETVKSLSGHTLLRLPEAAAFIGVTVKTLRELESRGLPNWPQRVYISPKVTGYRLMDMQALVDGGLGAGAGAASEEANA